MLNNESAEEFGRLVKQLERNSRKNAAQIIQSVNKKLNATYNFSSDDGDWLPPTIPLFFIPHFFKIYYFLRFLFYVSCTQLQA